MRAGSSCRIPAGACHTTASVPAESLQGLSESLLGKQCVQGVRAESLQGLVTPRQASLQNPCRGYQNLCWASNACREFVQNPCRGLSHHGKRPCRILAGAIRIFVGQAMLAGSSCRIPAGACHTTASVPAESLQGLSESLLGKQCLQGVRAESLQGLVTPRQAY